jgi:orotate phosphoribosyltransferase
MGLMKKSTIQTRARAYEIIRERSFVRRPIRLSSGAMSDHYFDMKPTMLHHEGSNLLSELVLERIKNLKVDYIGGLEMGAVPLIGPVVSLSGIRGRPLQGLFVRKAPKEHGTMRQIEGVDDVAGKNIVVVDDVTTTGQSAMKSIKVLQEAGANIVLVLSILDRQEGASELYKEAGIPFQSLFTASDFLGAE